MGLPKRYAWLTEQARNDLEAIQRMTPVPTTPSQIVEAALRELRRKGTPHRRA